MKTFTFYPTHEGIEIAEIDGRFRVDRAGNLEIDIKAAWSAPWVSCPPYWLEQATTYILEKCGDELNDETRETRHGISAYEREMAHD